MPPQPSGSKPGTENGQKARHAPRLSHTALESLHEWLKTHSRSPYPTKAEKVFLQGATGLNLRQLDTWFANARRRIKVKDGRKNDLSELSITRSVVHKDITEHASVTVLDGTRILAPSPIRKSFHCTFCVESFATKYDWTRHEMSVHLPLKRYICCPLSPAIREPTTSVEKCAYCGIPGPTKAHIELHNHTACQARPPHARTFLRKDHLQQHLRAVHECELLPHMETWLLQADYVNSRCGFCGARFTSWKERNDHIVGHYKQQYDMSMWKGCRGLDSAVSAQVVAALPPFLIHIEKQASSTAHNAILANEMSLCKGRTCTRRTAYSLRLELLVQELQSLIKHSNTQGFMVSDGAMQHHARLFIHGTTSNAYGTAADNAEWLDTFKRAYCLNILPHPSHEHAMHIPDDLEVYNDLGLPIPQCSKSDRAVALCTLFWADQPVPKTDCRFSAVPVPLQLALSFETIADVWPDAGTLGVTMITRDRVFECTIQAQIDYPLLVGGRDND